MITIAKKTLLLCLVMVCITSALQDSKEYNNSPKYLGNQLFIFQGTYDSLGAINDIAQLAARHDYVVFTHGFYLDGSTWVNGKCLDVNYSKMPELLVKVREYNPKIKIFVYVPATADHPNGCWPQPSIKLADCPDGNCKDFKTWTNLWLDLEKKNDSIAIDGIFVDLVHPALIGTSVRDSIFSYIKSQGKLIMANALSDTLGLKFAASSPFLKPEDFLLIEGYYVIAGYPNTQTDAMNSLLKNVNIRWAALATETYKSDLSCNSENMRNAYAKCIENGGSAFAYQSADLGTQTGRWIFCPNGEIQSVDDEMEPQTFYQDFILEQNYPNPFNPTTTIKYYVAKEIFVKISVYNVLGQNVRILVNEYQTIGKKEITFNAFTLPTGIYLYTMETGLTKKSKSMALIK